MADVFTPEFRSELMKRVRRERTLDEDLLYAALLEVGATLERNARDLPGSPDLAVRDCKLAIFVDGDFWHGRAYFERGAAPKTNTEFWITRFRSNRRRDRRVDRELRADGWSVARVWGSDVRKDARKVARRLARRLKRRSA